MKNRDTSTFGSLFKLIKKNNQEKQGGILPRR